MGFRLRFQGFYPFMDTLDEAADAQRVRGAKSAFTLPCETINPPGVILVLRVALPTHAVQRGWKDGQ